MDALTADVSSRRRAKFLIGGAVVAVLILGLVVWAMGQPGAASFYRTVSEVRALGPSSVAEEYRVNGKVVPESIERDGSSVTFAITDGEKDLTVSTTEVLPDAFWSDTDQVEVVAQGTFDGQTFAASEVLAKCPSKFKAKDS
jgi:cytochrome c-type biogenesis protein CcmE